MEMEAERDHHINYFFLLKKRLTVLRVTSETSAFLTGCKISDKSFIFSPSVTFMCSFCFSYLD